MRKLSLLLLALFLSVGASACIHKHLFYTTFDLESFDAEQVQLDDIPFSGQAIYIENGIGKITIIGQDAPDFAVVGRYVSIEVVKRVRDVRLEQLEVEVEIDDDEIIINTSAPEEIGKRFRWTPPFIEDRMAFFEIMIRVPREAEVYVLQELGEIEIRDLGSEADPSQVEVEQFMGDIGVINSTLETLNIEQSYGDQYIVNSHLGRADLKTGVGNISIQFDRDDSLRLEAKSGLRDIILDGVIDGDPGVIALMDRRWPGQELKLQQWDGDADIQMETRIGDIFLEFISEMGSQND